MLAAAPAHAGFLNGVTSRDGVDVIAVGDSGMIWRSVNGAQSTAKSYLGSTPLRAVAVNGLTLLIVGDGGQILRSTDSGVSWTTTIASGSPNLLAVEMPSASEAFIAGAGGTLLRSIDGGANWSPLTPGTSGAIRAIRFVDGANGWIVGDDGFIRSTADGGDSWNPTALVTPNHLYTIDQAGQRVWAAGANGTCWKSVDGGANWTPVNLKIDSRSDVRGVCLQGADSVFIAGGGGFIRRSVDDGATWTFLQHALMGEVTHLAFVGARGWITSTRSPSVMRTWDRGDSWQFCLGTTTTRSWSQKQPILSGSQRGSAFALNPVYRNTIYAAVGNRFYVSRDDGETWTQFSQLPGTGTRTNAMVMSPNDSLHIVCTTSAPQQLIYTTDGGVNWNLSTNGAHAFGEYGIPLEMDPDHPDTLFFGGDNAVLLRSTNFGHAWSTFGSTKTFRSPCDLIKVPEADSSTILVADGITGSGIGDLWRSSDGGVTFNKSFTVAGSEIPGLSMGRLNNKRAFGTTWSVGGLEQSDDTGLQWTQTVSTLSTWGTDVCREDPNVVLYGVYSGSLGYLSLDGGQNFSSSTLLGSNYSFYARDRACILAQQGGGLYKLSSTYTYSGQPAQTLTLSAPNGGNVWAAGSTHDVTWSASGVIMARIEYRLTPEDPWEWVADVPGYYGRYAWTLPNVATRAAEVSIRDLVDGTPVDSSLSGFTIAQPLVLSAPGYLDFGSCEVGGTVSDSVQVVNIGTATLNVTSAATGTAFFSASATNVSLAPGAAATVHLSFTPGAVQGYADQLTLLSNGFNAPTLHVALQGAGKDTLLLDLRTPDGGDTLQYGRTVPVTWTAGAIGTVDIDYRVAPWMPWVPLAASLPAVAGQWDWVVPDAEAGRARVRVRESGSTLADQSASEFLITVPRFAAKPYDVLDLGPVLLGSQRTDSLHIVNRGSAPLTISSVGINGAGFRAGRSALVIPAHASDSLGITYVPSTLARDTAIVTLVADDPGSPHTLVVTGFGTAVTGVEPGRAAEFALGQGQPNPFHASTVIAFALAHDAEVSLEVFNLQGQRVASLVEGRQGAGSHRARFSARRSDGSTLPAGVYFLRLRAGGFSATRKLLLLR